MRACVYMCVLLARIFPSDLRRPGIDDGFRVIPSLGFSPSPYWRVGRDLDGQIRLINIAYREAKSLGKHSRNTVTGAEGRRKGERHAD